MPLHEGALQSVWPDLACDALILRALPDLARVPWSRTTIWKDMVEHERHQTAATVQEGTAAAKLAHLWQPTVLAVSVAVFAVLLSALACALPSCRSSACAWLKQVPVETLLYRTHLPMHAIQGLEHDKAAQCYMT